jgi:hypothetical protein
LQQYLPNGVIKVISGRDSVAKLVCQNDEFASSLENATAFAKCEFSKPSVKVLGQIIDSSGCRVDPDKVKAIVEMERPDDISGIR